MILSHVHPVRNEFLSIRRAPFCLARPADAHDPQARRHPHGGPSQGWHRAGARTLTAASPPAGPRLALG